MRAVLLAFALFQGLTLAAHAATDEELVGKMIGKWGDTAACADGALQFNADKTFAVLEQDGTASFSGTFEVVEGKLNGLVEGEAMPVMDVSFEAETLVLAGGGSPTQRLARCA